MADLNECPVFSVRQFELLTLGDRTLQRRLIDSFLGQSSRNRADVLAAAHAGAAQFAEILHRLKGSCHFTAADRLLRLVRSMEGSSGLANRKGRLACAQAILMALDELENALRCFVAAGESP